MTSKDAILHILESHMGEFVSGQMLAHELSLSRTAIWKNIRTLKVEGYPIEAVTNNGYRLMSGRDRMTVEGVKAALLPRYRDVQVEIFDTVDSTNTLAKKKALELAPHGAVYIAEKQTGGRGRLGRSFYSPANTGLYMSVVLRLPITMEQATMVTITASVAVSRAIEKLTSQAVGIKWVNDIFVEGKKVCGILTEAAADFETGRVQYIVLGIGVNCTTAETSFPEELQSIAASIQLKDARNVLAGTILNELFSLISKMGESDSGRKIIAEYKAHSILIGKEISFEEAGVKHSGLVMDINDKGNLVVKDEANIVRTLFAGEVTLHKS